MAQTTIGWTATFLPDGSIRPGYTFNPWEGCAHKIDYDEETGKAEEDPACIGCYAEVLRDHRYGAVKWGPGQPRRQTSQSNRKQPFKWNRIAAASGIRDRVFSLSLGDWLDPEVPIDWLSELLDTVSQTPNLDWLLLTKRIELWERRMSEVVQSRHSQSSADWASAWLSGQPPSNVWLGATTGTQKTYDRRAPILSRIPARVRFLSIEPLFEPIDLLHCSDIDWIIIGGQSGANSNLFHLEQAESIVSQAHSAGIKVFVKQMGNLPVINASSWGKPIAEEMQIKQMPKDRVLDGVLPLLFTGKGESILEYPPALRFKEFPVPR